MNSGNNVTSKKKKLFFVIYTKYPHPFSSVYREKLQSLQDEIKTIQQGFLFIKKVFLGGNL